ncbi:MAG: carbohydrate binding domain-containing protein, partial [Luteolibacter sp.]
MGLVDIFKTLNLLHRAKKLTIMVKPHHLFFVSVAIALAIPVSVFAVPDPGAPDVGKIINPDFETGNMQGWKHWRTKASKISDHARSGKHSMALGPGRAFCAQEIKIRPNSRYRLSAWVRTGSGADTVE